MFTTLSIGVIRTIICVLNRIMCSIAMFNPSILPIRIIITISMFSVRSCGIIIISVLSRGSDRITTSSVTTSIIMFLYCYYYVC